MREHEAGEGGDDAGATTRDAASSRPAAPDATHCSVESSASDPPGTTHPASHPAGEPRLQGRDIVCVGFADWDNDVWLNQHHLMARLAKDNRVLFVESLALRRPQLASRDLKRIARRLRRALSLRRAPEGLFVLSPLVVPLYRLRAVRELNAVLLRAQVRRAARRLGLAKPILWTYVPHAAPLEKVLSPSLVVYHCVDDITAVPGIDADSARAVEADFAAGADLVFASSPHLAARMRTYSDSVVDAPNVADTELFSRALEDGPVDPSIEALPRPRIVFTGAVVTTKLDLPLLGELARLRPGWSIALVGPVGLGDPRADVSALGALPNVHLLGPRSYAELPAVLRGADAGIIPYALNQITDSVFPMKVYEYLAAGLPVVSTPLPALDRVSEIVRARDAQEMAAELDRALALDSAERRAERSRAAAGHSWQRRLQEIAVAVAAREAEPR